MSARDTVLATVRRSLGVDGREPARQLAVKARIGQHARGIVPKRGNGPPAARLKLFTEMMQAVHGTVVRVATYEDVPAAVADYLRGKNLPMEIRRGADPRLKNIPWRNEGALDVALGPSRGNDLTAVSHAFAAVAESGTLVLLSGVDNPTTLNFLPDHHLVIVDAADIAGDYETVWDKLREVYGLGGMPRTVNFITGPSRSGDIEQVHLLGAHGPRSLHVLVVGKA
ncbi:MAG TPA: lactate utilization protein [Xanthobacteraceae bacterium]|nr:lactate utilization protein [Xanthobacteraceae bacterium]